MLHLRARGFAPLTGSTAQPIRLFSNKPKVPMSESADPITLALGAAHLTSRALAGCASVAASAGQRHRARRPLAQSRGTGAEAEQGNGDFRGRAAFFAFFLHLGQAAAAGRERQSAISAKTGAVQTMHRREFCGMALATPPTVHHRQDLP